MGDSMTDSMEAHMTMPLIERLQNLTEPSREIDAEIALANGWHHRPNSIYPWFGPTKTLESEPPRYTASIDDALTLLSDNYDIDLFRCNGVWTAMIGPKGLNDADIDVRGPTPAIALLIAIMKAEEESK